MIKCPEGHTKKIQKAGFSITRKGRKQRYRCTQCGRIFYKEK